jgi:hypothetical protein
MKNFIEVTTIGQEKALLSLRWIYAIEPLDGDSAAKCQIRIVEDKYGQRCSYLVTETYDKVKALIQAAS